MSTPYMSRMHHEQVEGLHKFLKSQTLRDSELLKRQLPYYYFPKISKLAHMEEYSNLRGIFNDRYISPGMRSPITTLLYLNSIDLSTLHYGRESMAEYLDLRLTYFKSTHKLSADSVHNDALTKIAKSIVRIYDVYKDDRALSSLLYGTYCRHISDLLFDFFRQPPSIEELREKLRKGTTNEKNALLGYFINLLKNPIKIDGEFSIENWRFLNAYFSKENRKAAKKYIEILLKSKEKPQELFTALDNLLSLSNGRFKIPYRVHFKLDEELLEFMIEKGVIKKGAIEELLKEYHIETEKEKAKKPPEKAIEEKKLTKEEIEEKKLTKEEILHKYNIYYTPKNLNDLVGILRRVQEKSKADVGLLLRDESIAKDMAFFARNEYAKKSLKEKYEKIGRFLLNYFLETGNKHYYDGFHELIIESTLNEIKNKPKEKDKIMKETQNIINDLDAYIFYSFRNDTPKLEKLKNIKSELLKTIDEIKTTV